MKLLLYCTKAKPYLKNHKVFYQEKDKWCLEGKEGLGLFAINGKVAAECDCDLVEKFTTDYRMDKNQALRIAKDSCLSMIRLMEYEFLHNCLYGIHLKSVKTFKRPKELNDYVQHKGEYVDKFGYLCDKFEEVKRAPQNMMKVCDKDDPETTSILISIRPEHLIKILNGEKTIEVRRRILNELKELLIDSIKL